MLGVERERDAEGSRMPNALKTIDIDAPREAFYDLVVDFARYPEFLSDVKRIQVLRQTGEVFEVRFTIQVIKEFDYVLTLTGKRPESLTWTLKESGLFKKNDGGWKLEALSPERTRATYTIDVGLSLFVPSAITNRLVQFTLPSMLEQWAKRAMSLQGGVR